MASSFGIPPQYRLNAQQEVVPLGNFPAGQQKNNRLETEIVEVRNGVASPAVIARQPGPFILLVRELDLPQKADSFLLVPSTTQDDKSQSLQAIEPLLRLERKAGNPRRSLAGIVNLTAGEFSLQSTTTGKSICTIKGESNR